MLKIIGFDLDGTLTQHRTPLPPASRELLDRLRLHYRVLIVGAGNCPRILRQIENYPIDVIGNYGMQYCRYDPDTQIHCVTFPLLGTRADIRDKLAFDPDRKKRLAFYSEVCELFPEFTVFVGGSSSFDLAPLPYNKYYALDHLCRDEGYRHDEILYVGDDYGHGGNDEAVYVSDIPFRPVSDYTRVSSFLSDLL